MLSTAVCILLLGWTLARAAAQPVSQPVKSTELCNPTTQRTSLMAFYNRTSKSQWFNSSGWATADASAPAITGACRLNGTDLPDHCCFYGIQCCIVETCPPLSTFFQTNCGCEVGLVTALLLDGNNLSGQLFSDGGGTPGLASAHLLQAAACSLRLIDVQHNHLTGAIPSVMTGFTHLRGFNVAYNALHGSIPSGLSGLTDLRLLYLAVNNFSGPVPKDICSPDRVDALTELVLSSNQLTGTIDIIDCDNLIVLDIIDCNFSSIARAPAGMLRPDLHLVFMSRNKLAGSIMSAMPDVAPMLTQLSLDNNSLTGSLPRSLSTLRLLNSLVLHDNHLTGSLPDEVFSQLDSISYLDLSNNNFQGPLPPSLGVGRHLRYLDLSGNMLTGTLPLALLQQISSDSIVKLTGNALSCCGSNFSGNASDSSSWSYGVYDNSLPLLPEGLEFSEYCWTANTSSGLCCPLVKSNASNNSYYSNWFIDPEYYHFENCTCPAGLVLKRYSPASGRHYVNCELPDTIGDRPWIEHNYWIFILVGVLVVIAIVSLHWWLVVSSGSRPAILQSALDLRKRLKGPPRSGMVSVVVTDIEGYTALMSQHPELMMQALQTHNNLIRTAKWKNFGTTVEQEGDSYTLVFHEPLDACKFCLQAQQLFEKTAWPQGLFTVSARPKSAFKKNSLPGFLSEVGNRLGTHASFLRRRLNKRSNSLRGRSSDNMSERQLSKLGKRDASDLKADLKSSNLFETTTPDPISGMRVRMGIYTGVMPEDTLAGSHLVEMAKLVSDAASGGQVLMCAATFQAVNTLGRELGCVDASGMNYDKLGRWWRPWALHKKKQRQHQQDQDAVLLDMGSYLYCPKGTRLPSILTPQLIDEVNDVVRSQRQRCPAPGQAKQLRALVLYQLLAPKLAHRGYYFGSKLSLKSEWVQVDRDFYSAPGALAAAPPPQPNGPDSMAHFMALPRVTMVFVSVDGGKQFALRHRSKDVKDTHMELLCVIRSCLLQVPGGYLLRHADTEFKFMLAFSSPEAALCWCMAVQECALYAGWPASALKYWPQEFSSDGQLVFRGPRLKMGVCEGQPRSILPDYSGRADYLGNCVNQAARFMDAAAHGGQVACEQSLVEGLISAWSRGDYSSAMNVQPSDRPESELQEANSLGIAAAASDLCQQNSGGSGGVALEFSKPGSFMSDSGGGAVAAVAEAKQQQPVASTRTAAQLPSPRVAIKSGVGRHQNGSGLRQFLSEPAPAHDKLGVVGSSNAPHSNSSNGPTSSGGLPTLNEDEGHLPRSPSTRSPGLSKLGSGRQQSDKASGDGVHSPQSMGPEGGMMRSFVSGARLYLICQQHSSRRSHEDVPVVPEAPSVEVVALHLGQFSFKGVAEPISMVNVCHKAIMERRFPLEAPGGKGGRVLYLDGVLATASVPMLPVIEEWRRACMEQGFASPTSAAPLSSPHATPSPQKLSRNGSARILNKVASFTAAFSFKTRPSIPESRSRVFSRSRSHQMQLSAREAPAKEQPSLSQSPFLVPPAPLSEVSITIAASPIKQTPSRCATGAA